MLGLASWFQRPPAWLSDDEIRQVVTCIKEAEKKTSGEIRLFLEAHVGKPDPLTKAKSIFNNLKMQHTKRRNAVLIYIAYSDHRFALYADQGLFACLPDQFWSTAIQNLSLAFQENKAVEGLCQIISELGQFLSSHFPPENNDKNELPDEIIFG